MDREDSGRSGRRVRRQPAGRSEKSLLERAADPIVLVLVLAGFFDGLSGNPIHALVLAGAGVALVLFPPAPNAAGPVDPGSRTGIRPWWQVALPVSIAFGIVAGALERYTWPVTFAVVVPGIAGLVLVGRRSPAAEQGEPVERIGLLAWAIVIVSLGLFELLNFILQPSRLEGSINHPTLSKIFNEHVVGHPRQALALFVWLFVGWWLVEKADR
jgi:hypothetical protein